MAFRKHKPFTTYPDAALRNRIDAIAMQKELPSNFYAVKFMRLGLKRWERIQERKQQTRRRALA